MNKMINGKMWQYLIYIIGIVFAAGGALMVIRYHSEMILANTSSIKEVEQKTDQACDEVIGLKKDVYYIKEQVDKNAAMQQQILREIKELKK